MTIKRRIRIALSLMVILPALLMGFVFGLANRWAEPGEGIDPGGLPNAPAAESGGGVAFGGSRGDRRFLAEVGRLIRDEPGALADSARLGRLETLRAVQGPAAWSVYQEGRLLYVSRPMPGPRVGTQLRWSFRFPDGSSGLFVYSTPLWRGPLNGAHFPFAAIIAVLVLCNGFLSWWAASAIVRPLARLKDSALRVGEGDLDFRIEGKGDDELGEVAQAFETMRAKLFAALQKQLAEENARKELVAHVSHDLRTPIAIIRGHAEGLRDGVASTPAMRERYLAAILDRSRELESLIELLFAYSRLDLEQRPKPTSPLVLLPYLEALRDSLAQSFPSAKLRLDLGPSEGEAAELLVAADPELTRRALTNLVENAVKHCGRPAVTIEWRIRPLEDRVEIAVADDGEGVPEEDLGRLFDPFFRGDRARGRGGSGLGLAIVRKILETQGGSARAGTSSLGGLEVTLSFSRSEAHGQANSHSRG